MPDLTIVFLPLAALILLGYGLGKALPLDLKTIASLAIFGFTPVVGFGAAAQLNLTPTILLLPVVTFCCAATVGMGFLWLGRKIMPNSALPFLLPVATGSGNTGYFGLPLAIAMLGDGAAGIYLLANLGVVVFESTLGYYFVVRGGLSRREAFIRVLKLPLLYALALGLIVAALHIPLPTAFLKLWEITKGAYVCLGMMIIGVALARAKGFALSPAFLVIGLLGKFIAWPALAMMVVALDNQLLGLFTPIMHKCIIILSLAPMAANLAAYAAQSDMGAEQAAPLILISTIMAVFGLPFILPLLF